MSTATHNSTRDAKEIADFIVRSNGKVGMFVVVGSAGGGPDGACARR